MVWFGYGACVEYDNDGGACVVCDNVGGACRTCEVCGNDDGFVVCVWYVVMMMGLWFVCGMW